SAELLGLTLVPHPMLARRWAVILVSAAVAACALSGFGLASAAATDVIALITLQPTAPPSEGERLIGAACGHIIEGLEPLAVYRVAFAADEGERALGVLRGTRDTIRAAEWEGEQATQLTPNDTLFRAFQWNLRRIGMEQAWDIRPSATDVIVAVLDT